MSETVLVFLQAGQSASNILMEIAKGKSQHPLAKAIAGAHLGEVSSMPYSGDAVLCLEARNAKQALFVLNKPDCTPFIENTRIVPGSSRFNIKSTYLFANNAHPA